MFLGKGGSTEGGKGKDIKAGKVGVGNSGGTNLLHLEYTGDKLEIGVNPGRGERDLYTFYVKNLV